MTDGRRTGGDRYTLFEPDAEELFGPPRPRGPAPRGRRTVPPAAPPAGRDPRRRGRAEPPVRKRFIDLPRAGRSGFTRWIPSWRLVLATMFTGLFALVVAFYVAYSRTEVPTASAASTAQATVVFYADGKTVLGRFQDTNRTNVTLANVPLKVRRAVLAAEDRDFETNSGVSPTGIVRAAVNNLRGGSRQGASTITQQYVKNIMPNTTDRSYGRKVQEFFIALHVAQDRTKDQLLEDYLNTIYWGRGAYGVQAASRAWFGVGVTRLTPAQGAFLAGIINGPELYDPRAGKAEARAARARWRFVVDGMAGQGWLSAREARTLKFPTVVERQTDGLNRRQVWLSDMVRAEAKAKGYTDDELDRGGLRIVSTFDAKLMNDATRAVSDTLGPAKTWPKGTQAALASIDPSSGAVRAIYGGSGARAENAVTQDIVQAGSTFKPFGLIAALEGKGARPEGSCEPVRPNDRAVSLRSRFDGSDGAEVDGVAVQNFGNESLGFVDVVKATEDSVNSVFVAMNAETGPRHTTDVAVCAGLPKDTAGANNYLFNVLGTSSPHPIDMASAYATIAAGGVQHPRHVITSVSATPEREPYRFKDKAVRVFDDGVIRDATYAMQQVVERGTGSFARKLRRPAAGKTGTTDKSNSAWFTGFTGQGEGQLATVVALYKLDPEGRPLPVIGWDRYAGRPLTGGTFPVRVWTAFMTAAMEGQPEGDFPEPVYGGREGGRQPQVDPRPTQDPQPPQQPTRPPTQRPTVTQEPVPSPSETVSPSRDPEPTETEPAPDPTATETQPVPRPSRPTRPPRPSPSP